MLQIFLDPLTGRRLEVIHHSTLDIHIQRCIQLAIGQPIDPHDIRVSYLDTEKSTCPRIRVTSLGKSRESINNLAREPSIISHLSEPRDSRTTCKDGLDLVRVT